MIGSWCTCLWMQWRLEMQLRPSSHRWEEHRLNDERNLSSQLKWKAGRQAVSSLLNVSFGHFCPLLNNLITATSNACFWVWVHILVNLVAMAFLFTMNLYLPWVLNFNLSQARLLKETACNYVFSVLVHGIPSISAWISIHQNSQKLFCAKTSIGH